MSDIRQTPNYALFMEKLGWKVERIYNVQCKIYNYFFIRQFPIIGSFIKILRTKEVITKKELVFLKKYRPFKIQIVPDLSKTNKSINSINPEYKNLGFKLTKEPLTPTKTILIDLRPKLDKIFSYFTSEKRRAVRKALKNNVTIEQSNNINDFIALKNSQLWPFGFLLQGEASNLWKTFKPAKKAILLLALLPNKSNLSNKTKIVAGILLLFHAKTSHYWLASSLREGNKAFAPTILVWEALKLSKKLGYHYFDFEGIEDERFPNTKSWRGFSKFKKGFGGKEITYPNPIQKLFFPAL